LGPPLSCRTSPLVYALCKPCLFGGPPSAVLQAGSTSFPLSWIWSNPPTPHPLAHYSPDLSDVGKASGPPPLISPLCEILPSRCGATFTRFGERRVFNISPVQGRPPQYAVPRVLICSLTPSFHAPTNQLFCSVISHTRGDPCSFLPDSHPNEGGSSFATTLPADLYSFYDCDHLMSHGCDSPARSRLFSGMHETVFYRRGLRIPSWFDYASSRIEIAHFSTGIRIVLLFPLFPSIFSLNGSHR